MKYLKALLVGILTIGTFGAAMAQDHGDHHVKHHRKHHRRTHHVAHKDDHR
jgi:hypothetical protein